MNSKGTFRLSPDKGFLLLSRISVTLLVAGFLMGCNSDDGSDDGDILIPNGSLAWPIDCIPGITCTNIGYPDINSTGQAFNCGSPGYLGHQGTDIGISMEQMEKGIDVFAVADGVVLWVFDGKYDKCPDYHPDCYAPPAGWFQPGKSNGYLVCTELGDFCDTGDCCCFWCFAGGNVVVIRHTGIPGLFATRYDHFKTNTITVKPGDQVTQGQKIGEVGSAGNSSGPHLHFEVWGTGYYELADPWAGKCGPNRTSSMWKYKIPWDSGS